MPLLAFEGVTVRGVQRPRIDGLTVELPAGGITAVVGPSGSGKSTLLRCANRLVAPDAGVVRYRGADLATLDVLAHRREVGMVFQRPVPFPGSVRENLRVADPGLDDEAAAALLERVTLDATLLDREAAELSGGEAQRMGLARTLATRPRVVLADEPTASLDRANAKELERLLRQLADDGIDVVLVSHDEQQVQRLADRTIRLHAGRRSAPRPAPVVPVAGMLIGNSLSAGVVACRRLAEAIDEQRDQIEARLALGQPWPQAARPMLRGVLRTAISPQIESTKALGIVFLPGAMTGLILAGVKPLDAVLVQLALMYVILGGVATMTTVTTVAAARRLFTRDHRLLPRPEGTPTPTAGAPR